MAKIIEGWIQGQTPATIKQELKEFFDVRRTKKSAIDNGCACGGTVRDCNVKRFRITIERLPNKAKGD